MQLSTLQHRQLRKMCEFRDSPPTILAYVRSGWRSYVYVLAIGAIGIVFSQWRGWPIASGLFAGMILATFARDLGWYRRMVQSWPLLREITDWTRVEEFTKQSGGSAA